GRETGLSEGNFDVPTILEDFTTDMTIWKDEIFAPVLSLIRVKNLQEAVRVANQSEFANCACIFTNNAKAILYFREKIDDGMLGV
ncbi:aldehyde dehydrogenase family protein, partial [Listeria monocytogenes]|nr:aldehyde dehydrogenase family protein [Listeria monocytogenes]